MRPIDADALKNEKYPFPCAIGVEYAVSIRAINDAPTIDPKDLQPRGKNMTQMHPADEFICSVCGVVIQDMTRYSPEDETYYEYEPNFCPNCGARMGEEARP